MENVTTLSGRPPEPGMEHGRAPAPAMIDPSTGMHGDYWVLSEEERAKGFVRGVLTTYRHIGPPGPSGALRDLTPEEAERHAQSKYVKFEAYDPPHGSVTGRYWTQPQLDAAAKGGCGTDTTMNRAIAETYARNPKFYGATFCARCGAHFPVGLKGEFAWVFRNGEIGPRREEPWMVGT